MITRPGESPLGWGPGPLGPLILPARFSKQIRNPETGRVFPCCYRDCRQDGNTDYDVKIPHETPRWINPNTGECESSVYIFCGPMHQDLFAMDHNLG